MFGYEKGAFKGAVFPQIGELEKANGGTLHLGNIESLSLDLQSKVLYFLEEGEFFRMGGAAPIKIDVRVVATTCENLEAELNNSLMIGDSWENDIVGAAGVGMHQVFYNLSGRTDLPFAPTYQITDLKDLFNFL